MVHSVEREEIRHQSAIGTVLKLVLVAFQKAKMLLSRPRQVTAT